MTFGRISRWHRMLFDALPPADKPKTIGAYRNGPVYVVKQAYTANKIVYEAIPAENREYLMKEK